MSAPLRADNWVLHAIDETLTSPTGAAVDWLVRWRHADGTLDPNGNSTVFHGTTWHAVGEEGSSLVHFSGRLELGYNADGFQAMSWYQNYPQGLTDTPKHGGFNANGEAVNASGQPVDGNGEGPSLPPALWFKKNIQLTNEGKTVRDYTVTITDPETGAVIGQEKISLGAGESFQKSLQSPTQLQVDISHDAWAVDADGNGMTKVKTPDYNGPLDPQYTASPFASSGDPPTVDNSPRVTAGSSDLPHAPTESGGGAPSAAPTNADATANANNIKNAVDRGTAQDKANGDTAHADANSALDGQRKLGEKLDKLDSEDGGVTGAAPTLGTGPSYTGLLANVGLIKGDLQGLISRLAINPSGAVEALRWSVTLPIVGAVSVDLESYADHLDALRAIELFLMSIWFVWELFKIIREAFV